MKKIVFVFALAAAMLSCSQEEERINITEERTIVTESFDTVAVTSFHSYFGDHTRSKTSLIDNRYVYWEPSEVIKVFCGKDAALFTSTNDDLAESTDFTGFLSMTESTAYALYPNQEDATFSNGIFSVSVPSVQYAREGTYPKDAFVSIAKSDDYELAFYHLCGLLKIRFSEDGFREVTIKSNNGEPLSGKVRVALDEASHPYVVSYVDSTDFVTLKSPDVWFKKDTDYFLSLLPGTMNGGFTLTARIGNKVGTWEKDEQATIQRAVYSKATNPDIKMSFKDYTGCVAPDGLVVIHVSRKGTLDAELDGLSTEAITAVKITGVMNDVDFLELTSAMPSLTYLDISEVEITSLPEKALYKNQTLETLLLPSSLASLVEMNISESPNLQTVVFGPDMAEISSGAFKNCSKLDNLAFPEDMAMQQLNANLFQGCTALKEICLPKNVRTIKENAFNGCGSITRLDFALSSQLQTIESLSGLTSITQLMLPSSVTTISDGAFQDCSSLEEVGFCEGAVITSIGPWFNTSLRKITMPDNVEEIKDRVFKDCLMLKNVTIPASVTTIGSRAFSGCTSLESVVFKQGSVLESLGEFAFAGCTSLKEIIIPAHLTALLNKTFYGCTSLERVEFAPGSVLNNIASWTFDGCSSLSAITIPAGVTTLWGNVFSGCTILENVSFERGASLTAIYNSFVGCDSLKTITIPASVEEIGESAFYEMGLTNVFFEEGSHLKVIHDYAFYNCSSLKNIDLPDNLTTLGVEAFCLCTSLEGVNLPDSLATLGRRAFFNCFSLEHATLPDSLATLGQDAFHSCYSLQRINIPTKITSIPDNAFGECKGLTEVSFADISRITTIGSNAFSGLQIKSFPFNEMTGLVSIGSGAFRGSALEGELALPSSLSTIGYGAFAQVTGLTRVRFAENPNSISIGSNAFEGCTGIIRVVFEGLCPKSVVFNSKCFYNCTSLTTVDAEYCNNISTVGSEAFGGCSALRLFYNGSSTVARCSSDSFSGIATNAILKVRANLVDSYRSATGWSSFSSVSAMDGHISGISLNVNSRVLGIGREVTLYATIEPADAENKSVVWSSSNEAVATVDQNGHVTAVGKGTAKITVESVDGGLTATCTLTVRKMIESIEMPEELVLVNGKNVVLEAILNPANPDIYNLNWSSSDESVATVALKSNSNTKSTATVTSVSLGTTIITAEAIDSSGVRATCRVTVGEPVTGISLNATSITLNEGESQDLVATITPANACDKSITWTSSNESVATVDENGRVTAVSKGSTTITATANGAKYQTYKSCSVTVKRLVSSIALEKTKVFVPLSESVTVNYQVYPSTANNTRINCTQSTYSYVSITKSDSGRYINITGNKVGTTIITLKATDGSGVTADLEAEVIQPVTSISFEKRGLSLDIGEQRGIIATVSPEDATYKSLSWTSSDESIATVDQNGLVTGIAYGEAVITASATDISGQTKSYLVRVEPEAVDLGLSVMWATRNLGADWSGHPGDYFAWGDPEVYYEEVTRDNYGLITDFTWKPEKEGEGYSWNVYKWAIHQGYTTYFLKYNPYDTPPSVVDNKTLLERGENPGETIDDAARYVLGGNWRMPTVEEFQELIDNCDWTYCERNDYRYSGYKVTSRVDPSKSIFIPSAGQYYNDGVITSPTTWRSGAFYWSASIAYMENGAAVDVPNGYCLMAGTYITNDMDDISIYNMNRAEGLSVRAVLPKE